MAGLHQLTAVGLRHTRPRLVASPAPTLAAPLALTSQVKDWGSGKPEELGSLQVDADSRVYTAGGGEGGAPAMPFHEALARRLEVLQTQGALGVAQVRWDGMGRSYYLLLLLLCSSLKIACCQGTAFLGPCCHPISPPSYPPPCPPARPPARPPACLPACSSRAPSRCRPLSVGRLRGSTMQR
jgi:hypothetical protein